MAETSGNAASRRAPLGFVRAFWFSVGWLAVALGTVGIVVPGLPTTVFFIVAAWCFARSSPRFETWVLNLPKIGPMVQAHRTGLGMPKRAKVLAVTALALFAGWGVWASAAKPAVAAAVAIAAVVGVAYIVFKVPTREAVLARRGGLLADGGEPAR